MCAAGGGASVRKLYWAVVEGAKAVPQTGEVSAAAPGGTGADADPELGQVPRLGYEKGAPATDAPLAERMAVTRFRVLARAGDLAWLELEPVTGPHVLFYVQHERSVLRAPVGQTMGCPSTL